MVLQACSELSQEQSISPLNELEGSLVKVLVEHSVDPWYPLVLDSTYGGYLSDFSFDWQPNGPQNKMIVSQARHIWTCSKLAEFHDNGQDFQSYAAHGFDFLRKKMWDAELGGFYHLVDQQGTAIANDEGQIQKNAYGNAFAIYGLSAYYQISNHQPALDLAVNTFKWLDQHSYDSLYGGYFQFLAQDGTPFVSGYGGTPPKDQNSSIHLLEAFTELYKVWPDEIVRARLTELLELIRDTITKETGYMNLFFNRDWTPFTYKDHLARGRADNFNLDHVSFGHDIETAYLIMEASEVLGLGHDSNTLSRAKTMVDHTLKHGWDSLVGGIYDGGYYFDSLNSISIIKNSKVWWAQAEALNTLLIMSELYPEDPLQYSEKFETQWHYIQNNLIDREHRGWYWGGLDQEPERESAPKAQIWKVNYHTARSLMNCINRIRSGD